MAAARKEIAMNARSLLTTATLALVCALGGATSPAQAAGRCDDARTMVDQRACEAANQGSETLRRFVERTRMIYSLSYYDFARDETSPPARVASPQQPDAKS
jgi:hypothetical protein